MQKNGDTMNKKTGALFLAVALVPAILPITSQAWFFGPSNFDECVISESKEFDGPIPKIVLQSIHSMCGERFSRYIHDAFTPGLDVSYHENDGMVHTTINNSTAYAITAIKIKMTKATCEESSLSDFRDAWVFEFDPPAKPNKKSISTKESALSATGYQCFRRDGFWGKTLSKR